MKECTDVVDKLEHQLIWLEMQLVEQLDVMLYILCRRREQFNTESSFSILQEISKDFELNYGDIVSSFKESVQSQ